MTGASCAVDARLVLLTRLVSSPITSPRGGIAFTNFRNRERSARFSVRPGSAEDVVDDVAGHVGQAEVTASVAVGQALVVQTQQGQEGRVQIRHMHAPIDRLETVLVGSPIR